MRKTIRDVSDVAGVSFKTVSRVLNNERHVRPATRERVEAAMRELNFRPSYAARALAGGRSFQIALLYDNPSPYYIYHTQIGVRDRCREQQIRMIAQSCDVYTPGFLEELSALIDETHIDGLILVPPLGDVTAITGELDRRDVNYVRIAAAAPHPDRARVSMDDEAAAAEITRHLLGLGHRRIGFIRGHPDHVSARLRWTGFDRAMREHGLVTPPELIAEGDFNFDPGQAAAAELLMLAAPPTAIFASNDDMAAGALAAAHDRGIVVPDQLSITGFDDTGLARAVWPPLTTIRQPIRDMAYAAADLLLDPEKRGAGDITVKYKLIIRGSTGPVR